MTAAAATTPTEASASAGGSLPAGWEALRADGDVQFAPVQIPAIPPRQPGTFERLLAQAFNFLSDLLGPLGKALAGSWWWLQWAILALAVIVALLLLARLLGGVQRKGKAGQGDAAEDEWRPDTAGSMALLEEADRLAAEGCFEAATHLLLQRSVGQIAAARPDWTRPSSTARELAALPALPDAARAAFGVIADRVERSLFALRSLDREDWEAARAAYADFALARLDTRSLAA